MNLPIIRRASAYAPWVRSGASALIDQASYSVANFAIALLLARTLSTRDYGAYTVAFLVLLFVGSLHAAIVLEPFTVFGAVKYRSSFGRYLAAVAKWSLTGGVLLGLCVVAFAGLGRVPSHSIGNALGLAMAIPALLLAWTLRRAFYVTGTPAEAVRSSVIQSVLTLTVLYVTLRYLGLSGFAAFAATAAGALGGASFAWMRLGERAGATFHEPFDERSALRDHWRYGRWMFLTTVTNWIVGNGTIMLAAAFLTLTDVGALQAFGVLMTPVPVMLTALGTALLPSLVVRHSERGAAWLRPAIVRVSVLLGGLAAATLIPLVVVAPLAVELLYKGKYAEYIPLLPYLVVNQVIASTAGGVTLGLRGLEASRRVFTSYAISAVATLLLGTIGVMIGGLYGLVIGMILTQTILLATLWTQLRHQLSLSSARASAGPSDAGPTEIRLGAERL